ncbi:hypothetical protein HY622_00185 [Candidatus Uhrbacteria bacterium]|nr:hypothetical protein [Candidatus Uhrbacteria bacterium]
MATIIEMTVTQSLAFYTISRPSSVACYLVSTPQTRAICSDPFVFGVRYTDLLREASIAALQSLALYGRQRGLKEHSVVVLNILRGGLNYGLRDALARAYGWDAHRTAFISSQRARDDNGEWHITENRYHKISLPDNAHIIFGDVVATGVSLQHALDRIVEVAREQRKSIHGFTFFTIGGARAVEILEAVDYECRRQFSEYVGSSIVYYEGIFGVADDTSKLSIVLPGTDLLHSPATLTPEFIQYQATALPYAIERCAIYDAGSRSFDVPEYLDDVAGYWRAIRDLADHGMTYRDYLTERFPEDPRLSDTEWRDTHASANLLRQVAEQQLAKTLV